MNAATIRRDDAHADRLLVVDLSKNEGFLDLQMGDFPRALRPGDLLVVNDAATLPASLHGSGPRGEPIELRLLQFGCDDTLCAVWTCVLFGAGDFRTRTEDRPPPPALSPGDLLRFSSRDGAAVLTAIVEALSPLSPRLVTVRFQATGAELFAALYVIGRPVQYSYVKDPLALWDVQTPYAARPWSVELPSAGRSLTIALLRAIADRGVKIATITHAAGLSTTGDPALDARLPLPERYEIPEATVRTIAETKANGGRVIAVGTSVVRAIEGRFHAVGALSAGTGITDLRLGPASRLRVIDGLLTGVHDPGTSHFELLQAFASPSVIRAAAAHASRAGYLGHELGDFALYLRRAVA